MPQLGVTELVIVFFMLLLYALPIAFAVWVIIALKRIRSSQEVVQHRLAAIERKLPQNS